MWNPIGRCENDGYNCETKRLQSFKNWPVPSIIKPETLAAAGFYYTGQNNQVKCFECQLEISHWIKEDNPMVVHQRWVGLCRFVRKIPCGNVPIGVDPNTILPPPTTSLDLSKLYQMTYHLNAIEDNFTNSMEKNDKFSRFPKFPEYTTFESRLRTFDNWPKAVLLTGQQLANAGWFYTKKEDRTQCYHCGGSLNDWEINDDPREKHWIWFPNCYL